MLRLANILTPVDPAAPNPGLVQALFWARHYRATLHAVQVSPFEGDTFPSPSSQWNASDEVRQLVEETAYRAGLSLDASALRAVRTNSLSLVEGLLRYEKEHAIDLIVTSSSSGKASSGRTLTGILHGASCSVFIASTSLSDHPKYQRLLAPIDFSRHARRGLGHAKSIAALYGASLDVLHVLERPRYLALSATDMLALSDARLPERKALRRMRSLVEDAPGPNVETRLHVAHGRPASQIAAFAAAHDNDLVVLSSHGSTGQSQHALGTVTTKTLRHLPLPVFLVKSFGPPLLAPARVASKSTESEE